MRSYDQASNQLNQLVKSNNVDGEAIKGLLGIRVAEGDFQGVTERLNKYLEINPSDTEAWLELADMYLISLE